MYKPRINPLKPERGPMFGFVFPTRKESSALIGFLKNASSSKHKGRTYFIGELDHQPCVVFISGIGKVQCASTTQLLIDHFPQCKHLFHLGVAGALSPQLQIGDLIIGNKMVEHDHRSHFFSAPQCPEAHSDPTLVHSFEKSLSQVNQRHFTGCVISGDEDIVTSTRRNELHSKHDALCVDWESYAFAKVSNLNGIPCLVIRGISDLAHEHTEKEYKTHYEMVAHNLCKNIAQHLKTSPLTTTPA